MSKKIITLQDYEETNDDIKICICLLFATIFCFLIMYLSSMIQHTYDYYAYIDGHKMMVYKQLKDLVFIVFILASSCFFYLLSKRANKKQYHPLKVLVEIILFDLMMGAMICAMSFFDLINFWLYLDLTPYLLFLCCSLLPFYWHLIRFLIRVHQ